jgi:hypothetical protein
MKSVILIIVISMLQVCSGFANSGNPLEIGSKLSLAIEFGNGPQCSGWGICHLGMIIGIGTRGGTGGAMGFGFTGHIQLNNTNSGFDLDFSKDDLLKYQADKLIYLDGKTNVTFSETFQLSNDIRDALGAGQDLIIRPGTYPLTFIDGIFTIKLPY